jgi:TPR repeat protein
MAEEDHAVCLGYLCLSYTATPIRRERNVDKAKEIARSLFPLLLSKCERGSDKQYLYLNKDELFILGSLYSLGMGCAKNPHEAFKCFQLSALDGLPTSICCLGVCYAYGTGVTRDREAAFKLYRESADLGDAIGQFNLASCYWSGIGTSPDYSKAIWFYYISARQGYRRSVAVFQLVAAILGVLLLVTLWITLLVLFLE